MNICLVGMSNLGKTHWAKALCDAGFNHVYIDELVGKKLAQSQGLDIENESEMSAWMGQPWDEKYERTKKIYIQTETEVMETVIDQLRRNNHTNTVIDTTGSVVHLEDHIQNKLRELSTVVCLDAHQELAEEMLQRYIAEPKPVFWGDLYIPMDDPNSALREGYNALLEYRMDSYRTLAHHVIPYDLHRLSGWDVQEFLAHLRKSLQG